MTKLTAVRGTGRLGRRLPLALLLSGLPAAVPAWAQAPVALPSINVTGAESRSLTVPTTEDARTRIEQTPGAVEVVPDSVWRDTAAKTMKDMLDYTPGVFVQPKWGEDSRLSIRGSGLSRNFHLRGIQLFMDGVPTSHADGSADFQEIDPTAFRYLEVYKGANGLRYGANSLGGALNFVSPTGYDADLIQGRADIGSFGFRRLQASTGGNSGGFDGFLTASYSAQDGFRDHSQGDNVRTSGNLGWRLTPDLETRFYFTYADIEQEIPGSVTRTSALSSPKTAAAANLLQHYQRNIESWRVANKTTFRLDNTRFEVGGYYVDKQLTHPIFQYLEYDYHDWGLFGRVVDERQLGGHLNRLTVGVTAANGWIDNKQSVNLPGARRGTLLTQSEDRSSNTIVHAENSFDVVPGVSVVGGLQYVDATRKRTDELPAPPNTSGKTDYEFLTPKIGVLWQVDPGWQVFGNLSKAGEPPTFGELNFNNVVLANTKAQESVTLEVGTRGRRSDFTWDVAVYRAWLENEYQFFDLGGGNFQVTNADKTIHQGVELGFGWAFWKGLFRPGADPDRLWLNAAYTYSDFRFDGDRVWRDNELPGAPRHLLRAELLYRNPAGFYLGPNIEWVPEAYYVDNANRQETKAYALLGFRAGYAFGDHVSVFVEGRNLTDEKYIASASTAAVATTASALYEPGFGRAAYAGLQVRW